jgi:hypothetical protein
MKYVVVGQNNAPSTATTRLVVASLITLSLLASGKLNGSSKTGTHSWRSWSKIYQLQSGTVSVTN